MQRRTFLHSLGTAGAAAAATTPTQVAPQAVGDETRSSAGSSRRFAADKAWLFWDLVHCERLDNAALRPGRAELQADATFVDPAMWGLNSRPTVYRDDRAGDDGKPIDPTLFDF
jgi:hypothetical protein